MDVLPLQAGLVVEGAIFVAGAPTTAERDVGVCELLEQRRRQRNALSVRPAGTRRAFDRVDTTCAIAYDTWVSNATWTTLRHIAKKQTNTV